MFQTYAHNCLTVTDPADTNLQSWAGLANHIISNIKGSSNFEIRQNSNLIQTKQSSNQKTLYFEATLTGNDTFTITKTGGSDTTAPAVVSNLTASTGANAGGINLTWTAPGDDGNTGTATTYIVKYSTSSITTDAQFNAATTVTGAPAPAVAGTIHNITISGLTPGTTYYFAIKTRDEVPNISAISNCPSAIANQHHPADLNQNNRIEMKELIGFIGKWKSGQASLSDVLEVLGRWLSGT